MYFKAKIIAITLFSTIYYICHIFNIKTNELKNEYRTLSDYKKPLNKVVAVIGTGINCRSNFIKKNLYSKCGFSLKDGVFEEVDEMSDEVGHEHFIISQIIAINPEVKIVPVKIPLSSVGLKESDIIKALELIISLEYVDIVNISFGSIAEKNMREFEILQKLTKEKIVVMSAGNDGYDLDKNPQYPVSYDLPYLVKVGGRNIRANFGSVVDIYPNANELLGLNTDDQLTRKSGTSFSTALITGLISLENNFNKSYLAKYKEILDFDKLQKLPSLSLYNKEKKINRHIAIK